eukprot:CAMPEP_0197022890 /NCGR_PEP_ID=MMETSP1384-20130603/3697_1 /TAXON_ID=29189 /ORGANISM="Ammonia sp." /LENGTH=425 /DNA_ID=CAMNT_0042451011 /DNA_START=45 /DNA_END=1322 /DNA_ORIENTATION=+
MIPATATPIIYYSVISFGSKVIVEVNEYEDDANVKKPHHVHHHEHKHKKKEKKYIRSSKKILKKIEQEEIRRPDGMGTLISGMYSYNYIHGFENSNHALLESLLFLCVLPLYQSNLNVTASEREIAFNFLSSIRRDFLTGFTEHLQYIYDHPFINSIAVRIRKEDEELDDLDQLTMEDENLCTNLHKLSHIMIQRMHGNYKHCFEFTPLLSNDQHDEGDLQHNGEAGEVGEEEELEDLRVTANEHSESFINIVTPTKNVSTNTSSNASDSFVGVSVSEHERKWNGNHNAETVQAGDYGSITQPVAANEGTVAQRSKINNFLESIVDVKQQMTDRIKSSMSSSSLRSFGAMSDDKFVDYETRPLIASSSSMMQLSSEYARDYYTNPSPGFVVRHRKKVAVSVAVLLVIYLIVVMFCGWDVQSCGAK